MQISKDERAGAIPPTVDLSPAEHLSGGRLRSTIVRIRTAAAENHVVKFTPDAALAIADLIELLAGHAGIELPDASEGQP
jgi:hypothetical protein